MLRRDGIDEDPLNSDSEPFESWRNVLQLRRYRAKIPPIEICVALKRNEFRSAVFDSRNALPVRKVISWPSARRTRVIASSGLIWPVAGVEAIRIFMILVL
jgi:hypothetical protein